MTFVYLFTGLFSRVHGYKWAQTHLALTPSKGLFCKETSSVSCWNYVVHSHKQMTLFRIFPLWPVDKVCGVDNANIICKNIFCLYILQIFIALYKLPSRDSFPERTVFLRRALDRVGILVLHHAYGWLKKRIWKENNFWCTSCIHNWNQARRFLTLCLALLPRWHCEWTLYKVFTVISAF